MKKLLITGMFLVLTLFSLANGYDAEVVSFGITDTQTILKINDDIKSGELVCVKHFKNTLHITGMWSSNYSVYDLTVQKNNSLSVIYRSGEWTTDEPDRALKESGLTDLVKCKGFSKSHSTVFGD